MTSSNNFYLTTAINYTNGSPHFGHAYEVICADILARYHSINGKNVFFATGTDEHGQKIADTAKAAGVSPKELCDKYVNEFTKMNTLLQTTEDRFIRTTDPDHLETAQLIWNHVLQNDDIY